MKFSEFLVKKLYELDMSQTELAHLLGRSISTVNYWVHGKSNPQISDIKNIAQALGVRPGTIKKTLPTGNRRAVVNKREPQIKKINPTEMSDSDLRNKFEDIKKQMVALQQEIEKRHRSLGELAKQVADHVEVITTKSHYKSDNELSRASEALGIDENNVMDVNLDNR